MKKVKVEMFEAEDGTRWPTEAACLEQEANSMSLAERLVRRFEGISVVNVEAALRYEAQPLGSRSLAEMIEQAGRKCAEARIAAGGAKRKRKEKTGAPPPVGEAKPEERSTSPVEGPSVSFAPAGVPPKPVDWTGVRAITDRGLPSKDNPFPAHGPREETRQA